MKCGSHSGRNPRNYNEGYEMEASIEFFFFWGVNICMFALFVLLCSRHLDALIYVSGHSGTLTYLHPQGHFKSLPRIFLHAM